MTTRVIQKINWKKIWAGNKSLRNGIRNLLWSLIRFIMAGLLWSTALRLVPLPEPYKNVGIIFALISLGFFVWGIRGLWFALQDSGLRGFCIVIGNCFLLLLIFNLLTYPEPTSIHERILPALTKSGIQIWSLTINTINKLINAPEDFRFAYTGSNAGDYLSGFPTPDPNNKIIMEAQPEDSDSVNQLTSGGYALVNTQNGDSLKCHSEPDLTFPVSVSFSGQIRLLILEGPISDNEEGVTWWKLHGSQGEGWCNAEFLLPTD